MATMFSAFLLFVVAAAVSAQDEDYSDEVIGVDPCVQGTNCLLPNCSCFGKAPPNGLPLEKVPQFVMLTFDDAVTPLNIQIYRKIALDRKNSNGCNVSLTFFVSHEYNDYEFANELYKNGSELAVHSITHETNTDIWKHAPGDRWAREMAGMRRLLAKHALIPPSEVKGHRAPFLQTAGDVTFMILKDKGFAYDSSMPTLSDPPLWPYTLDYGYPQDCQIRPCPKRPHHGFWLFPMAQWHREGGFRCSMVDACVPYPTNQSDTFEFFKRNFERHYGTNKAPFPVFLHEGWLRHPKRLEGYLAFLDYVLKKGDTFVVTMSEVLHYMQHPKDLATYIKDTKQRCYANTRPLAGNCSTPVSCHYRKRNIFMKSCSPCVKRYPWLDNIEGEILKGR